jgi:DNA-binding transcriptional LysR family regulator
VIGASTTPATYYLPDRLVRFREQHPALHVDLVIGDTRAILEKLDAGAIEIAIVGEAIDPERYRTRKLADDEVMLRGGRAHPWFARSEVEAKELAASASSARRARLGDARLGRGAARGDGPPPRTERSRSCCGCRPTRRSGRRSRAATSAPSARRLHRRPRSGAARDRAEGTRHPPPVHRGAEPSREPSPAAIAFLALLGPPK